jgi:hypothetical protein
VLYRNVPLNRIRWNSCLPATPELGDLSPKRRSFDDPLLAASPPLPALPALADTWYVGLPVLLYVEGPLGVHFRLLRPAVKTISECNLARERKSRRSPSSTIISVAVLYAGYY